MPRLRFTFRLLVIAALILCLGIFAACTAGSAGNDTTQTETGIEFTNLEYFKVVLYSDSSRHNVFAEIDADSVKTVPAAPNTSGVTYYPTYYIDIPDIPEASIPYHGQAIITVIEENKTNKVFIPQLENIAINTAYLKIINNSIYSLLLQQGDNEKIPLGGRPSIITPDQNAAYEVTPGASLSYKVMRNTTIPIDFPAGFTEFEKGKVYTFTYDGTNLVLTVTWPIPSRGWPQAPENVQAELTRVDSAFSSVRLSWNPVYGAESYRVYRAWPRNSEKYSSIATIKTLFYDDTSLFSNDLYQYQVCAIKDSEEGKLSKVVSVNTSAPPGNVRVVGSGDTFVLLVWDSGGSSCLIYRSESENGNYLNVTRTITRTYGQGVNGSYNYVYSWDTGLEPSTTYYYKVVTVIDGAEGMRSDAISTTTISPIDFRVTDTTATSISLAWNTVSGAKYEIYRSASENGTFTGIANNMTVNTYTDTGLSPNSTYYYRIGIVFIFQNNNINTTFTLRYRIVSATTEGK